MRDTDVAPKYAAFREARRDHALAAADYFKIAGRNFEVELELPGKNLFGKNSTGLSDITDFLGCIILNDD